MEKKNRIVEMLDDYDGEKYPKSKGQDVLKEGDILVEEEAYDNGWSHGFKVTEGVNSFADLI